MGGTSYSTGNAHSSRVSKGFYKATHVDQVFEQNRKRTIHESMDPKKALLREARDSATHPNTYPIILGLDMTGSMGDIPMLLIKNGLPDLMGGIIQKGVLDPALLFVPFGDHECDDYPLQVSQFESGDVELDMWLTRTYIEGGGGGNGGESYIIPWYYAINHTVTDAWEKRKQKGLIVTIGDEPFLDTIPKSAIEEIFGVNKGEKSFTAKELYQMVSEKWDVYHIHIKHNSYDTNRWEKLLGKNLIVTPDYKEVPKLIVDLVASHALKVQLPADVVTETENKTENKPETSTPTPQPFF